MKSIRKALPSFFTSLGLISGCISIVISLSNGNLTLAGYWILVAAVFDFVDGMAARVLKTISAFGKQLDSLADVISFGVAPAMILYRLLLLSFVNSAPGANFDVMAPATGERILLYSSFLVAVFSAFRLALFNLDPEQAKEFKGLPTPANALFICALGFMAESSRDLPLAQLTFDRYFLLAVIVLSCYLLVSPLRMFSLKFSSPGLHKNLIRYIFLIASIGILLVYQLPGLGFVILLYILMSLANAWFVRAKQGVRLPWRDPE
jgi:CDP-diacylglycerol--serine O-phosphatidyltransferase